MALLFGFTGTGDRDRLLALGDVDQREREAVERAKRIRAVRNALRATQVADEIAINIDADIDAYAAERVEAWSAR
jgi:hypothetical protein